MKRKSAVPDFNGPESPKLKQQPPLNDYYYNPPMTSNKPLYSNNIFSNYNYSNEPIELVARRFQEIERHELEMAKIRVFERIQNEFNLRNFSIFGNYEQQFRSPPPVEYDNTQSYRHNYENYNDDHPTIRNNFVYPERENQIVNQQQPPPVKRIWIEDDEEEDKLYFYSGGRKKKTEKTKQPEEDDDIIIIQPSPESQDQDQEYEENDPLSSWSADSESDYERMITKKKNSASVNTSTSVKPKAYAPKIIDLDAPTIMKLPPNPIPTTWAHIVHNPLKAIQKQLPSTTEILTKSIASRSWLEGLKLTNPVQGILMRPPFDGENFTIKKWIKFMQKLLPTVMPDGYLFIWVEREELADVIRAAEHYLSFKYVENLCWIRRNVGNRLLREAPNETGKPALFYKSKMTLLILRRDPNNRCKLRHQRNPDCVFDFVGPGRMPDGRVYDVIETLLDGTKMPGPHLMHLWAGNSPIDRLVYQARKQWIRVLEVEDPEKMEDDGAEEEVIEDDAKIANVAVSAETVEDDVKDVVNVAVEDSAKEVANVAVSTETTENVNEVDNVAVSAETTDTDVKEVDNAAVNAETIDTDAKEVDDDAAVSAEADENVIIAVDKITIVTEVAGSNEAEKVDVDVDVDESEMAVDPALIEMPVPVRDENDSVPAAEIETEAHNLFLAENKNNLETQIPETDHVIHTQVNGMLESTNEISMCDPIGSIETIVNETLNDLNQTECKIPGSSTFDEDFCNFITCDPSSNC